MPVSILIANRAYVSDGWRRIPCAAKWRAFLLFLARNGRQRVPRCSNYRRLSMIIDYWLPQHAIYFRHSRVVHEHAKTLSTLRGRCRGALVLAVRGGGQGRRASISEHARDESRLVPSGTGLEPARQGRSCLRHAQLVGAGPR